MKNYFTTVRVPTIRKNGGDGELWGALSELVNSLRIALSSLDRENFSEGYLKRHPGIHTVKSPSQINVSGAKAGDLFLVCGEGQNGLCTVSEIYVYEGDGKE